jgi:hypothetical protein
MESGYIVRFVRRDRKPNEEYLYRILEEARQHFDLFNEDDSGLYDSIEVIDQMQPDEVIVFHRFVWIGDV